LPQNSQQDAEPRRLQTNNKNYLLIYLKAGGG